MKKLVSKSRYYHNKEEKKIPANVPRADLVPLPNI